jgi:hypothetical protein
MNALDSTVGRLDGVSLTLGGLVGHLCIQGRWEPLIREALAALLVRDQAGRAGLSVTDEELQSAANDFRRRQRLHSSVDTLAWLAARNLSVDDFEAALGQDLLAVRLRHHLTGAEAERYFSASRAGFECLTVAQVLLPREDLARELASQVREEGRELADVAREHGLQLARARWYRKDLGEPLASAPSGDLVGPVGTPKGFVLALVEDRRPAELDSPTRRHIQNEMYQDWLTDRMRGATINLPLAEVS